MQQTIQVLVIFLVISFWLKMNYGHICDHTEFVFLCYSMAAANEKRQLMHWVCGCKEEVALTDKINNLVFGGNIYTHTFKVSL